MIDEMTNDQLVSFVMSDENATETELELASRLATAMEELDRLATDVREMEQEAQRANPGGCEAEARRGNDA